MKQRDFLQDDGHGIRQAILKHPVDRMPLDPDFAAARPPTTEVFIIIKTEAGRELKKARWGSYSRLAQGRAQGFQARHLQRPRRDDRHKRTFKHAYRSRRCIIPASGFFDWTDDRMPHFFSAADGDWLAFAGFWENWRNPETGDELTTWTMIVREATPGQCSVTTACPACCCARISRRG